MSRSSLSPVFSSRSFTVSSPMFKSLIHFELIFVMKNVKGPVSFFCMWMSRFPTPLMERLSLSHTSCILDSVIDKVHVSLWSRSLLCCWSMSFYANTILITVALLYIFKLWPVMPPTLDVAIQGLLWFHMHNSISIKQVFGILIEIALNL